MRATSLLQGRIGRKADGHAALVPPPLPLPSPIAIPRHCNGRDTPPISWAKCTVADAGKPDDLTRLDEIRHGALTIPTVGTISAPPDRDAAAGSVLVDRRPLAGAQLTVDTMMKYILPHKKIYRAAKTRRVEVRGSPGTAGLLGLTELSGSGKDLSSAPGADSIYSAGDM